MLVFNAGPNGLADFAAATRADLQAIYNTPTGKQLQESLAAVSHNSYINYGAENRASFPYNAKPAFYKAYRITPGQGWTLTIEYNIVKTLSCIFGVYTIQSDYSSSLLSQTLLLRRATRHGFLHKVHTAVVARQQAPGYVKNESWTNILFEAA